MGQNSSADWGNVKLRKLLSADKSHVRETSLFTGAIPNPVRNSNTSRFVSVPGQNPGRSSLSPQRSLFVAVICHIYNTAKRASKIRKALCLYDTNVSEINKIGRKMMLNSHYKSDDRNSS